MIYYTSNYKQLTPESVKLKIFLLNTAKHIVINRIGKSYLFLYETQQQDQMGGQQVINHIVVIWHALPCSTFPL